MILDLHRQGLSVSEIARQSGLDRKTVRRYIERGLEPPAYGPRKRRPALLDPFSAYLRERVKAYPGLTRARLLRELRERGYEGATKGMALFPRKIDGRYAMIGRQDNENLYLICSDDLHVWNGGKEILRPRYPWEFVQIGNCGSPIELDEGWLLLTHGVGAVRRYSIGASLLDKRDPSKVIARCSEPLVRPEPSEREGYVPNVVYTCGAIRHGTQIVLPYAVSDTSSNFATIEIAALLQRMEHC